MPSTPSSPGSSGPSRSSPMSPGQLAGQGQLGQQQQRQSTATTIRDSTSSSVNGLIQQSFNWLEVDDANNSYDNSRPTSLVPPKPAFRSDRTSNLRVSPSTSSIQLPSVAEEAHQHQFTRTDDNIIDETASTTGSGQSSNSSSPLPFLPPSRGASMQPSTSNTPYSPLIPISSTLNTSPPLLSQEQESDHSLLPYSEDEEDVHQQQHHPSFNGNSDEHSRHRNQSQSSGQYFYPDGGFHAANSPPLTAPPDAPLPPSPPSIGSYAGGAPLPPLFNQDASVDPSSSSPSPSSSSFIQTRQTPSGLYDSPHSPRLPSSPGLEQHQQFQPQQNQNYNSLRSNASYSSNNTARSASANGGYPAHNSLISAAGVPLPSSPYTSYHSLSSLPASQPYPARTASIPSPERTCSNNGHQQYPSSASLSSRQGPSQYTPPPRNASNNYNNTSTYDQSTSSNHAFAAGADAGAIAGGGAAAVPYFNNSPLPSPSYLHPNSQQQGAAASYYSHPNATQSSIWNDNSGTDYDTSDIEDEKKAGGYGPLDRGIGLNNLSSSASSNSLSSEKRSLRHGGLANAAGNGRRKKKWWIIAGVAVLVIGAAVVGVVVYMLKRNSNDTVQQGNASDNANGSGSTSNTANGSAATGKSNGNTGTKARTIGGDGSTITMENGETFTYLNQFGGTWSSTPFDDSAKAQSYTPALNERWDYSSDKIYGVNIGGWLHLEPFIAPAMFEPFANSASPAIDEWSLSLALGDNLHDAMVEHFETFITEEDFAQIAGAGLNWVRLAIPFWAVETYPGEPFLEGVCWQYFLKAITWARKYGLRINLDLHTIPGSQNGWNHSGKFGSIGFLNGVMGMANAQRTTNYIRILTEFINQPEYRNVIPMFGIINEAQANVIGDEVIRAYYLETYNMMREITGIGEGNGPVISLHDGFSGNLSTWNGYLAGSDRIMFDSHPYLAFDAPNTDSWPVNMGKACDRWGPMFNLSMANVGFTHAGEFSLGINDCGQYLNGVTDGMRYDGTHKDFPNVTGSCDQFMDVSLWDDDFRSQVYDFALASMDTFQNWFFWTWKIGNSTVYNRVATPMWSYSLGLQEGYIPTDPRVYHGACAAMAEKYGEPAPESLQFDGTLEPWMTGGAGAGQIAPTQIASYSQWPPISMANIPLPESLDAALLPTYTATAAPLTLTASPTPTTSRGAATPVLNGPYFTPIAGCANYLDPWGAAAATPIGTC